MRKTIKLCFDNDYIICIMNDNIEIVKVSIVKKEINMKTIYEKLDVKIGDVFNYEKVNNGIPPGIKDLYANVEEFFNELINEINKTISNFDSEKAKDEVLKYLPDNSLN